MPIWKVEGMHGRVVVRVLGVDRAKAGRVCAHERAHCIAKRAPGVHTTARVTRHLVVLQDVEFHQVALLRPRQPGAFDLEKPIVSTGRSAWRPGHCKGACANH